MRRILSLFLLILILVPQGVAEGVAAGSYPNPQGGVADSQVDALMARMGPEERVGQLFLVTYYGSDASEKSNIASLISRYHVGGVVLSLENDNFTDTGTLAAQIHTLAANLQTLATNPSSSGESETPYQVGSTGPYVPLFIAMDQDSASWLAAVPQERSGLTPLPSSMAVGATWNPALAENVGRVVGKELPALGINLFFGPSADVVEVPKPSTSGDLGTQVFGISDDGRLYSRCA
jgi:beta-N-acetylhexosaminidase